MRVAFFDAAGRVLAIADGIVMGPPSGTEYEIEVGLSATVNTIFYDTVAGEVKPRQPFDVTIERNKISNIPAGTLAFTGDFEIVDDGEIEFLADVEDTLFILLDHPEYLSETVIVETGP